VKTQAGIAAGELVEEIGRTFSVQREEYLFSKLRNKWPKIEKYLYKIDPKLGGAPSG
jgi:hypothetical protein